jgi:hypothetical protein
MFDAVQQNDELGFGSFQQLATWAVEEEKRVYSTLLLTP